MLLADDLETLVEIEREATEGADVVAVLHRLRRSLSLDGFGLFMLGLPSPAYPTLSRLLPAMAADQVQRNFTGNSGETLLGQTVNFVRALSSAYSILQRRSLQGARILDYGCGYGRISRLMYYYADPDTLWLVDPWDEALRLCREARMLGQIAQSDYLPDTLPVPEGAIDLAFAFSVFTHTSRRATERAFGALRRCMAPEGLLCVTIRPLDYWRANPDYAPRAETFETMHREEGFAFAPHTRAPIEGDVTYGDTSMTIDFIERSFPDWKVVAADWAMVDRFQRYVYLAPA